MSWGQHASHGRAQIVEDKARDWIEAAGLRA